MENSATVYDKRMSHLVGIGLVLGFLLPHTSTAFLLVNPLLCLLFFCFKSNRIYYKNNWIVIISLIITLVLNVGSQNVETKSLLRILSLMLYFICFPIVGRVKVPDAIFYFVLFYIVLSQFIYIINIPFLTYFFDTIYPFAEDNNAIIHMRSTIEVDNMTNYRLGGLYRNANHCARELTMLMATYGILNGKIISRKSLFFLLAAYVAIIFTGSRTGFFIGGFFLIMYVFSNQKVNIGYRIIVVLTMVIGFVNILINGSDMYRGINVIEGFSNSADSKFFTFWDYLSHEKNPIALLFGYLDATRFERYDIESMSNFDCDYGAIIFSYGIVGFLSILFFNYSLFKRMDRSGRLFFLILLWMVSSAIYCSNRAVFNYMFLMSIVYGNTKRVC